ncbi:MAG: peptidyl-prolyl cis-trans isomerase [Flammeovirgaceae bacterium]|nr:peptidyl-prolyl cis-trans isomerase [Flammeovirgaceae bacterium]
MSPIIRTRFGYHLIKVIDRRPARGEVEVSHILLRTGTPDDAKVKSTAFTVYDQLKGGRNWEEVCKEYSQDSNTSESGGLLKPFGIGALASVPEFEAMAFALQKPGDISDPFQSSIGWHIIRLEKKIPLPPYSEMESSLKRRVSRDERLQLSKQSLIAKRKKQFLFVENQEVKQAVMSLADSSLIQASWKYLGSPDQLKLTIFSVENKPVLVSEWVEYVKTNQKKSSLSPGAYFSQLYENLAEGKIQVAEEEELKKKYPEYNNLLTEYREGILLFEIMETEVWNRASSDTLGQRQYYQANRNNFQAGDRIEARIFSAQEKSTRDEFASKINKGDSLTQSDLKRFKSIQNFRVYKKRKARSLTKFPGQQGCMRQNRTDCSILWK